MNCEFAHANTFRRQMFSLVVFKGQRTARWKRRNGTAIQPKEMGFCNWHIRTKILSISCKRADLHTPEPFTHTHYSLRPLVSQSLDNNQNFEIIGKLKMGEYDMILYLCFFKVAIFCLDLHHDLLKWFKVPLWWNSSF